MTKILKLKMQYAHGGLGFIKSIQSKKFSFQLSFKDGRGYESLAKITEIYTVSIDTFKT